MGANKVKRRRNYFIKKKFQASFFIKFALLLLLESVLIAALFLHVSRGTLTTAYHGTELTIQKTGVYFFVSFILISLIIGIAVGIAGIFVFMYLSHRIGGPLYRFEKTMEEAKMGDFSQRVKLRKTDQLDELRSHVNAFLEEMDSRLSELKDDVEKGLDYIYRDKNGSSLDSVKKILGKIKTSLEHFRTSK